MPHGSSELWLLLPAALSANALDCGGHIFASRTCSASSMHLQTARPIQKIILLRPIRLEGCQMAESCKQQEERVEETVFEPVDQWVEQQEQRCRNEPCNPWLLCLNKVVCWVVTELVKVTVLVAKVIVRVT